MAKVWKIEGYESNTMIFEKDIPIGLITERKLDELLRCLVAKYSLDDDEIVNSHLRKNTRRYMGHLEVARPGKDGARMCGSNPYFAARIVDVQVEK